MSKIKLVKEEGEKDHYRLFVDGVDVFGKQERSTYRHIIEVIDNGINTGI